MSERKRPARKTGQKPRQKPKGRPPRPRQRSQGPGKGSPRGHGEEAGPQWIYGLHAAEAALLNPIRTIHRVCATENALRGLELTGPAHPAPETLRPRDIDRLLLPGAVHQGLAVLADPLPEPDAAALFERTERLVILDQVTDPHNLGAVLRTAAFFGVGGVVTTRRNSPPLSGVVAKTATGALEHVPVLRVGNLARFTEEARGAGFRLIGLAEEAGAPIAAFKAPGKTALVLGAEGKGLRQKTRETCDGLASIPAQGPLGSLNVSNAAAVALYALFND